MKDLSKINEKIKTLKTARDILQHKYSQSEFHEKKEKHPLSPLPPSPEDEEIYKLLTAIQQLDKYVKEYQEQQFSLLKKHS